MSEKPKAGSYGQYLKVPELLNLQKTLSDSPHHDETLFIIIHQVYELWFKQMLHEVDAVIRCLGKGDTRLAVKLIRRLIEIQRVLIQQVAILETMTPPDFMQFREHLNPASGFQSYQFRALEFRSGLKEPRYLEMHRGSPDALRMLQAALTAPSLRDAWEGILKQRGLDYPDLDAPGNVSPTPGVGTALDVGAPSDVSQGVDGVSMRKGTTESHPEAAREEVNARRMKSLLAVYEDRDRFFDLYVLAESLIEYDENFLLWRQHHILMVERMIGMKQGTGGSEGVSYLRTTLGRKCFPDLWEVRTHISRDAEYGG